jgi:cytochrome c-type biogenesis protein CcmE
VSRRAWTVAGVVLLVGFAGFAFATFRTTLTPSVTFDDARAAGRVVQVAGALEKESTRYDEDEAQLHFALVEEESGGTMPVRYDGLRPANFEDAISIVAIGSWDEATSEFAASKLLVKCPSKYQGAEVTEVKTYR